MAMFGFSGTGLPEGMEAARETFENSFSWGILDFQYRIALIDGAARDAGSSVTTELRPGLLMGIVTSSGKWKQYNPIATDGTDVARGIMIQPYRVTDVDGTNQDLKVTVCVGGSVMASRLYLLDNQARAQLENFKFDDTPANVNKFPWIATRAKTADYTVLATDKGVRFVTDGAGGAVVFTLPALSVAMKGTQFAFYNTVNQNMTVTSAAGNDIVTYNDLAASSIAISTTDKKIGLGIVISTNSDGTKWISELISGTAADFSVS